MYRKLWLPDSWPGLYFVNRAWHPDAPVVNLIVKHTLFIRELLQSEESKKKEIEKKREAAKIKIVATSRI